MKSLSNFKRLITEVSLNNHVHIRRAHIKSGMTTKNQAKLKWFAIDLYDKLNDTSDPVKHKSALSAINNAKDDLEKIIYWFDEFVKAKATEIGPSVDDLQNCIIKIFRIFHQTVDIILQKEIFLDEIEINYFVKEMESLKSEETLKDDFQIRRRLSLIKTQLDFCVEKFKNSWYFDEMDIHDANEFKELVFKSKSLIYSFEKHLFDLTRDTEFLRLVGKVKNLKGIIVKGDLLNYQYDEKAFRISSFLTELKFKIEMINLVIKGVQLHENSIEFSTKQTSVRTDEPSREDIENDVRNILSPLKLLSSEGIVIVNEKEFNILVEAYTNLIHDNNKTPDLARIAFNGKNKEFYPPFRALHDRFKIKFRDGGALLQLLIIGKTNNTLDKTRQRLNEETIMKNIKNSGKS